LLSSLDTLNKTRVHVRIGLQYKKARLVLVGLDDAGKTSLMYMLKESRITQTFPTERPSKRFFMQRPMDVIDIQSRI